MLSSLGVLRTTSDRQAMQEAIKVHGTGLVWMLRCYPLDLDRIASIVVFV